MPKCAGRKHARDALRLAHDAPAQSPTVSGCESGPQIARPWTCHLTYRLGVYNSVDVIPIKDLSLRLFNKAYKLLIGSQVLKFIFVIDSNVGS